MVTTNITEEQIYKEFLRLGMEQLIAQDLSKRYYHNELTYRDLENLEKQFGIKFDNLVTKIDNAEKNLNLKIDNLDTKIDTVKSELTTKIDNVEKNLQKDMFNLGQMLETKLETKLEANNKVLFEKLKVSNRIVMIAVVVVPTVISVLTPFITSLINSYLK
ncbi:Bdr family repetitive protein [Borreliella carolinensis]|uniref:Bdr family repetitive protein n=1 Tax=Borreliella carolinensis TaxID=478174 RepID=UPI003AF0D00B